MGQSHVAALRLRLSVGDRRLAHDLGRGLVLARARERGVAQQAVRRPGAKIDLRDQLGPNETNAARLIAAEPVRRTGSMHARIGSSRE